jgi:hypothetical protein
MQQCNPKSDFRAVQTIDAEKIRESSKNTRLSIGFMVAKIFAFYDHVRPGVSAVT